MLSGTFKSHIGPSRGARAAQPSQGPRRRPAVYQPLHRLHYNESTKQIKYETLALYITLKGRYSHWRPGGPASRDELKD